METILLAAPPEESSQFHMEQSVVNILCSGHCPQGSVGRDKSPLGAVVSLATCPGSTSEGTPESSCLVCTAFVSMPCLP
ncbi:hypothetical protein P7K49_028515 [Saguinus oedipus]|uniref:Uncharacterized protein n=1 Tax=Saguinus oedipus TaxID=9490 RepID=A0ABQ9U6J9_SAGOE|nr:hypothetical protein P7K49_028515 [Saguinus oedipus]